MYTSPLNAGIHMVQAKVLVQVAQRHKEKLDFPFLADRKATLSPINGTIILKFKSRDIANSSTKVPSEADESATALSGQKSTASEAIFELSISKLNLCVIQTFVQSFHLIIVFITMSSTMDQRNGFPYFLGVSIPFFTVKNR